MNNRGSLRIKIRIMVISMFLVMPFYGCGGGYAESINLNSGISNRPVSIEIDDGKTGVVPETFSYRGFSTTNSYEELVEKIKANYSSEYNNIIELDDENTLIQIRYDNHHYDYFLLSKSGELQGENWFLLDNLQCRIIDDATSSQDKNYMIFPKYLTELQAPSEIYLDDILECSEDVSIQEIYDFYKESGYYKTEIIQDDEVHLEFDGNGLPNEIAEQHRQDGILVIKILEKSEKTYLIVTREE